MEPPSIWDDNEMRHLQHCRAKLLANASLFLLMWLKEIRFFFRKEKKPRPGEEANKRSQGGEVAGCGWPE